MSVPCRDYIATCMNLADTQTIFPVEIEDNSNNSNPIPIL